MILVYGLVASGHETPTYVGQTADPVSRFVRHDRAARAASESAPPRVVILDACATAEDARIAESMWIRRGRARGWALRNVIEGTRYSATPPPPTAVVKRLRQYHAEGNRPEILATRCGCSVTTLRNWRQTGQGPRNDVVLKALDEALRRAGF